MTGLDARFGLSRGEFTLDVELEVDHGETVAVLGPNGAGKSTLVAALAGLAPIDRGRIVLGDRVLDDPDAGVFVAADERSVGVVFQDHLLFPRMTALDNVAFGLRARGNARRVARAEAARVLDRVGIADLADRRPAELSGGQAQRVALARVLATAPAMLLLDEPLAALDASIRIQIRAELRRSLADFGGIRVLVTHDPIDALVLADRLVIVEGGRVVQAGRPQDVVAHPATPWVADLAGVNLVRGTLADSHTVVVPSGQRLTVVARTELADRVAVAIRPQAVALFRSEPAGSPRNTWSAVVRDLESDGERVRVALDGPLPLTAEITAGSAAELGLAPGARVWAGVKAVDLAVYDA